MQPHREAASGELRGGTQRAPGPRAHSAGSLGLMAGKESPWGCIHPRGGQSQQQQRGGGPQAQLLGSLLVGSATGEPPPDGGRSDGRRRNRTGPPALLDPGMAISPTDFRGRWGKRRNSCHVGGGGGGFKHPAFKRRRREAPGL